MCIHTEKKVKNLSVSMSVSVFNIIIDICDMMMGINKMTAFGYFDNLWLPMLWCGGGGGIFSFFFLFSPFIFIFFFARQTHEFSVFFVVVVVAWIFWLVFFQCLCVCRYNDRLGVRFFHFCHNIFVVVVVSECFDDYGCIVWWLYGMDKSNDFDWLFFWYFCCCCCWIYLFFHHRYIGVFMAEFLRILFHCFVMLVVVVQIQHYTWEIANFLDNKKNSMSFSLLPEIFST